MLLLGGTALLLLTGPKPGEEGKLLAGIDPKDVTRVVVERRQPSETKLVFVRVDKDHWKLEEPYDANLDGRQVESLVERHRQRQDGHQGGRPVRQSGLSSASTARRCRSR